MDVGEWLRGLGLGQYETVFREHAIDMDVLADLMDAELAQIGVPLGDRKRLLKAIASLSKTEPSSSSKEGVSQSASNFAPRSASKIDPILETGAAGSARPGGAGLGCAAGARAARLR
jgi:hypothetical protein